MSIFIVRIELHHASTRQDYENLHTQMDANGLSRTIQANDGVTYALPTAEYTATGDYTIQQVLTAAKAAATTTGKTFAVFISEAKQWMSAGLQSVR